MKAICLKMTSGEELIAKIVSPNSSILTGAEINSDSSDLGEAPWSVPTQDLLLEDIRIITIQQVSPGQVGIGFVPWAVGNPEGKIKIKADSISAIYPPREELERGYLGQTSGIQIAGPGSLPPSTKM